MDKRLKAIDKYYTDLEYGNDEETNEALTKISILAKEMTFTDVDNFSERFLKTASVIEENLSLFKAAAYCEHPDTITTIIEYLNYFGMKFMLDNKYEEEYEKGDIVLLVLLTILKTCSDLDMRVFLRGALIGKSALEKSNPYELHLRRTYRSHNTIILLADSDLIAVIACLRNRYFDLSLDELWVQEVIREKFLWHLMEYFKYAYKDISHISSFRTSNELFTISIPDKLNIVSIWTEDVVFAKNLAMSLNGDVLFINTYMDFYGGIVLLPFKIFDKTLPKWCKPNFDDSIKKISEQKSSVHNLFYDGMWQLPVKGTYWIHDDSQWANATSEDVNKCINSAEKGFKIWSSKSITCRKQILCKFAFTLKCSGKSVLADIISKLIKFSCIYEKSLSLVSQSGGLEVTNCRNPRGVIILKEEDEVVLFRQLMQILIVGNSVITICDANSCSLVPYCNMFSISEIPPGVINLLSREDVKELELSLCGMDYASYAKRLFSEDNVEKTYINLTKPKHIIVPLR